MPLKKNKMHKNKYLNIKRLTNLLKREAHVNLKRNLLIIGAMYSLLTIYIFLVFEFGERDLRQDFLDHFHFTTYTIMLFVGGVFITSFSFIELRSKMKSHFYLLTPSSNLEKFIANLSISFFGYLAFFFISYLIYSRIFNWIALELYDIQFSQMNISSKNFILVMQIFILVHSIFFLGSLSFKKYPLILTPIAGFLLIAVFSLANKIIEKIVFINLDLSNQFIVKNLDDFLDPYESIVKIGLFYILPIILWFIAYLKFNEKEY